MFVGDNLMKWWPLNEHMLLLRMPWVLSSNGSGCRFFSLYSEKSSTLPQCKMWEYDEYHS